MDKNRFNNKQMEKKERNNYQKSRLERLIGTRYSEPDKSVKTNLKELKKIMVENLNLNNTLRDDNLLSTESSENPHGCTVEVNIAVKTKKMFTQSIAEFLLCLAQKDDRRAAEKLFLNKIIDNDQVPIELFLCDENNKKIRVNDVLGSYFDHQELNFKDTKPNSGSLVDIDDNISDLPPFPLPDEEKPLLVYVSAIKDPDHFVIQPLDYREELKRMTIEMTKYYEKNKSMVNVADIQKGRVFAFENDEKKWRRGSVIHISEELGEICLKNVDYGDTTTVNYSNIYYLMPRFFKNPILAMKAELAGIVPKNSKWSMQDSLRFSNMVTKREMCCVIVEASGDLASVMLYDTSAKPPIDVGAALVKEGRATDITTIH